MRFLLLTFIGVITTLFSIAGTPDSATASLAVGIRAHYGFVIIHSRDIRAIGDSYPFGIEVDLAWHYNSKKSYNRCLCHPRLGINLTYWDFDNPEILGQGYTSLFYIEPYFGAHRNVSFSFRAATGLAWCNKPYDKVSNPDNLSYSTRLSFALALSGTLNVRIRKGVMLNLSAGYNHISNGGMNEPNKGINYPTLSFGADYYIRYADFYRHRSEDWKKSGMIRDHMFVYLFGSAKQLDEPGELDRYPVIGVHARYSHRVSRINAIAAGAEILSDGAHKEQISRSEENTDHHMAGLMVGNEFLVGKFLFNQMIGIYLYDPFKANTILFQRYGLDYKISNRFVTGINLKAHGHVADFIDFRLGFYW